jgi:hypothetical protein
MTNYVSTLQASELLIVGHQTNKLVGKNIFSFLFYTSLGTYIGFMTPVQEHNFIRIQIFLNLLNAI